LSNAKEKKGKKEKKKRKEKVKGDQLSHTPTSPITCIIASINIVTYIIACMIINF
jgi:hypothetical protein